MSILAKTGVTPDMTFKCRDCQAITTGEAVLNGEYLYIVKKDTNNPALSVFRCECCQDDWEDKNCNYE